MVDTLILVLELTMLQCHARFGLGVGDPRPPRDAKFMGEPIQSLNQQIELSGGGEDDLVTMGWAHSESAEELQWPEVHYEAPP